VYNMYSDRTPTHACTFDSYHLALGLRRNQSLDLDVTDCRGPERQGELEQRFVSVREGPAPHPGHGEGGDPEEQCGESLPGPAGLPGRVEGEAAERDQARGRGGLPARLGTFSVAETSPEARGGRERVGAALLVHDPAAGV